jgi:hypothetical protein
MFRAACSAFQSCSRARGTTCWSCDHAILHPKGIGPSLAGAYPGGHTSGQPLPQARRRVVKLRGQKGVRPRVAGNGAESVYRGPPTKGDVDRVEPNPVVAREYFEPECLAWLAPLVQVLTASPTRQITWAWLARTLTSGP